MRYHFIDAARVFAMLLGIPYHVSLLYSKGPWYFKAGQTSLIVDLIGRSTTIFRMPLFFVLAGFLSSFALRKTDPREWLGKRTVVLLVPVIVGVITINQFIFAITDLTNGDWRGWLDTVERRDSSALVAHLWFLVTLFWFSFSFVAAWEWGWFRDARIPERPTSLVLVALAFPIYASAVELIIRPRLGESGFINFGQILKYLPYFVLGAWLAQSERLFAWFLRLQPQAVALAIVALAAAVLIGGMPLWLEEGLKALSALFVSKLVLGIMYRFGDFEIRWVNMFSRTSFTIYVIHLPISLALGSIFFHFDINPIIEFIIISAATLVISQAISLFVQSRPVLRFLFNGASIAGPRSKTIPAG